MTLGPNYFAVIGDIVKSRGLEEAERRILQERLKSRLDLINQRYNNDIRSRFLITTGDEIQGLLLSLENILPIIFEILLTLGSVDMRFGIGYGSITTEMSDYAIGMDGKAFHYAREALEAAHDYSGVRLRFRDGEKRDVTASIDIILSLVGTVWSLWSHRQREMALLRLSGLNQSEVALQLGVTPSAVSQRLNASRLNEVEEAQKYLIHLSRGLQLIES